MRAAILASALLLAACGEEPEKAPTQAAELPLNQLSGDAPTVYAMATKEQVGQASAEFNRCADALADMSAAEASGSVGKTYNAANVASHVCERGVERITNIRNEARTDFRISTCRQAAFSGVELADGILKSLDQPTAENQGKVETMKSGFDALAESCRTPDADMLDIAIGPGDQ